MTFRHIKIKSKAAYIFLRISNNIIAVSKYGNGAKKASEWRKIWQETRIHKTTLLIAETVTKTAMDRTATDRTATGRTALKTPVLTSPATSLLMHLDRTAQVLTATSVSPGTLQFKIA